MISSQKQHDIVLLIAQTPLLGLYTVNLKISPQGFDGVKIRMC